MTHNIKINKTFMEPILKRGKTFEIRKNEGNNLLGKPMVCRRREIRMDK